ncbi:hypothetical protein L7F22_063708 [Adiantum nelumboides]|nr:hypothetical protein [Adiantum nelumboides]
MAGQESFADMEASCKEGPVLTMINKRLRALRKKYNKILQIEESKAQGKQINKEQEDVLKGKVAVCVLIEEYEKLRPALKEELEKEIMEIRLRDEEESSGDEKHLSSVPSEEKENIDIRVEERESKAEGDEENAGIDRVSESDAACDEGLRAEKLSNYQRMMAHREGSLLNLVCCLLSVKSTTSFTSFTLHSYSMYLHQMLRLPLFGLKSMNGAPASLMTVSRRRMPVVL